jgi:hypothetical protein
MSATGWVGRGPAAAVAPGACMPTARQHQAAPATAKMHLELTKQQAGQSGQGSNTQVTPFTHHQATCLVVHQVDAAPGSTLAQALDHHSHPAACRMQHAADSSLAACRDSRTRQHAFSCTSRQSGQSRQSRQSRHGAQSRHSAGRQMRFSACLSMCAASPCSAHQCVYGFAVLMLKLSMSVMYTNPGRPYTL